MRTISLNYIILFFFVLACASKEAKEAVEYKKESPQITTTKPKPGPDQTAKMLASELGTDLVTEISFKPGSAEINQQAKNKLKSFFAQAREIGPLTEAQVVTWGDTAYPSEKKEKISEEQKNLVRKRNESLEKYIKANLKELEFTAVSMAERPSFWGRITASESAKIKKSLQLSEMATTANEQNGETNSSKAIIMLFYSE